MITKANRPDAQCPICLCQIHHDDMVEIDDDGEVTHAECTVLEQVRTIVARAKVYIDEAPNDDAAKIAESLATDDLAFEVYVKLCLMAAEIQKQGGTL